jgi:hypothetical protein
MRVWRLKIQIVNFCSACRSGWTMKHNDQNAISFLHPNVPSGWTGPVPVQDQNNKKDILCVTR